MAYQGSDSRLASPTLTQPAESIGPGQQPAAYAPQAAPVQSYPTNVNCQGCQPAPAVNYAQPAPAINYAQPTSAYNPVPIYNGGGCADSYNTFSVGRGFQAAGYGGGNYLAGAGRGCGRQWFGGVYGLYMERDGNPWKALTFSTPAANPAGYYPTDTEFVVNLRDIDNDRFGGAEFRLGATFGGGGGCGPSCGPRHAWEAAYWGLAEDEQVIQVNDLIGDANRLYGMIDYRGIEYSIDGLPANYRPVNDYYDYGLPTQPVPVGDIIRVRSITARNRFLAQNVEINLLHLPVLCGGSYGTGFGASYGGCSAGGGCDGCGVGGGCSQGGCGGGPRYSLTTLIGARYMRLDEDFMFRTDFENETATTFGFLSNNIDVDNHSVGAQLGCNGVYRLGCSGRWALHCNTNVGVYGNHMEVWNRMDAPVGGNVRLANGGNEPFDFRYEDDDVALVGELRVGSSYQYSCNWRFFSGYRVLGISGVALAFDQIPTANITPNQVSYVDSDGSIFLHGLQAGGEFTY